MSVHAEKANENKGSEMAHEAVSQPRHLPSAMQLVEHGSQAIHLQKLQHLANNSLRVKQLKALQGLATTSPRMQTPTQLHAPVQRSNATQQPIIQRFKGAPQTAEDAVDVPVTLNARFTLNHVAADAAEAVAKTEARIATGQPPAMVAGQLANSLAPAQTWLDAMDASDVVLPPVDDWGDVYGFADASEYKVALDTLDVQGWEAKGLANHVVAEAKEITKSVGGRWTVAGSEYEDEDDNPNPQDTHVSVDIDHCGE
jgi:hypothetical protein